MNINDVKIGQRVYWKGSEYEAPDSGVVTGFCPTTLTLLCG